LLVAVDADQKNEFESYANTLGLQLQSFGKLIKKSDQVVMVL